MECTFFFSEYIPKLLKVPLKSLASTPVITMRQHLTLVRMPVIKKQQIRSEVRIWKKEHPAALLVRVLIGAVTMENSTEILKIQNRTTI